MSGPIVIAFGYVLTKARVVKDLSVAQLASASGLEPERIRSIEAGHQEPLLDEIFKLAKGVGLDASILLALTEKGLR